MALKPIPRIGTGTGSIGNLTDTVPEERAEAMLRAASQAGVTYFDTAPLYGFGLAELRVGRYLRTLRRDDYWLSTKAGIRLEPLWGRPMDKSGWHDPLSAKPVVDYTHDGIMRSVEQSVNRLGIDSLDAVFIHDIDRRNRGDSFDAHYKVVLDQAIPTLIELKKTGMIGRIGVGINEADVAMDIMKASDIDILMLAGRLSILDFAAGRDALELARSKGVEVVAAAVFNSGLLARPTDGGATFDYREAGAEERARVQRLQQLCAAYQVPIQAAAMQFPLRQPGVASVVMGTSWPERVSQNVAWFNTAIPDAFWSELSA